MSPSEFVTTALTRRWSPEWSCYDLVRDFQREVMGIELPQIAFLPPSERAPVVADAVAIANWQTTNLPIEGAVLTMSRHRSMLKHEHYGVWTLDRCLHVNLLQPTNHDTLHTLHIRGWRVDAILIPA